LCGKTGLGTGLTIESDGTQTVDAADRQRTTSSTFVIAILDDMTLGDDHNVF
jgi:hypothetical protein